MNYEVIEVHEYDEKILDRKENIGYLLSAMKSKLSLMTSETGSGKTYSIRYVADKYKIKTIILVPKVKQAEQSSKKYGVQCVTSKTKTLDNTQNVIFCVYDSVEKAFSLMGWEKTNEVLCVVDEAHKLRTDIIFRDRAIKLIREVIPQVRVLLTTASHDVLMDMDFEKVVMFQPKDSRKNFVYDTCYMVECSKSLGESLCSLLIQIMQGDEEKRHALAFLNDTSILSSIRRYLEEVYGYKVALLCGEGNADHMRDSDREVFETLVNSDRLEGADIYLCTSVLEESINIHNKEHFNCIHTMNGKSPCYISLQQFTARLREKGNTCWVLRTKVTEEEKEEEDKGREEEELSAKDKYENAVEKIKNINEGYINMLELGLIESCEDSNVRYKGMIDHLGIYYFDSQEFCWKVDKDYYMFSEYQRVFKEIFKSRDRHAEEVSWRVKSNSFEVRDGKQYKLDKAQGSIYKGFTEEEKQIKREQREKLTRAISEFEDKELELFINTLDMTEIKDKEKILSVEAKELMKGIRNDAVLVGIVKALDRLQLPIKETLIEYDYDIEGVDDYITKVQYADWNALKEHKIIFKDLKLTEGMGSLYYKVRQRFDKKINKTLNNKDYVDIIKINNPRRKITTEDITDQIKKDGLDLLSRVYVVWEHSTTKNGNKVYKLGRTTTREDL